MPTVCFYTQLHQPRRLRRYSVFDSANDYFDDALNLDVLQRVVERCYGPALTLLLEQVRAHDGDFRMTFSITGVLLEQFRDRAPKVIDTLRELVDSGCIELCSETYHHSLAFCYSRDEFRDQVRLHAELLDELFGVAPTTFRNTELIYNNDLAHFVEAIGPYTAILGEGADRVLEGRTANHVYRPPHTEQLAVLLRNYKLSDDIAFRFSNRNWHDWPLTPEKFAKWITAIDEDHTDPSPPVCNLFIDFETFGEHQRAETGIFEFLKAMPGAILAASPHNRFMTISEAAAAHPAIDEIDAPHMISWADTERDLSVSDHFYYMCTKYSADADVHNYFNPYESPYDSYINFMNVLDHVRRRLS